MYFFLLLSYFNIFQTCNTIEVAFFYVKHKCFILLRIHLVLSLWTIIILPVFAILSLFYLNYQILNSTCFDNFTVTIFEKKNTDKLFLQLQVFQKRNVDPPDLVTSPKHRKSRVNYKRVLVACTVCVPVGVALYYKKEYVINHVHRIFSFTWKQRLKTREVF